MSSGAHKEAVLIHFSGPDQPGLTAALTSLLTGYSVDILDIGQAVVHEHLALGILLGIPAGTDFAPLRSALHSRAHELGLLARFTPVAQDALQHWHQCLRQNHFIIT